MSNRVTALETLARELSRGGRNERPVGVVLADLDHFKRVNDTFGHLAGDEVLRQAARRMLAVLRPYDTLGRYGGEEFLIIMPGCDAAASADLAERLRQSVAAGAVLCEGVAVTATLSLGVAAWDGKAAADASGLLRAVDEALYRAKRAGRNRAVRADQPAQLAQSASCR